MLYNYKMSGTVLYTVNDVINIDNTTKNLVFGTNPLQIFKNLNDENVDEVFRVVNGGWFDRVRVNNIYAHTAEQDSSYITGLQVGKINIGETGNEINVNGANVSITTIEDNSTTTINGKTVKIAENQSSTKLLGLDTQIGTKNVDLDPTSNNSLTEIFGKTVKINEYDKIGTQTTINGKTIAICDSNKTGTQTTINGKALNLAENSSTVVMKGIDTTIATVNQSSVTTINGSNLNLAEDNSIVVMKGLTTTISTTAQAGSATTINGKSLNLAEDDSTVIMKGTNTTMATSNLDSETIVNGKKITIGEDRVNTDMYLHSEDLFIGTSLRTQNIISEADNYQINDNTKGGFLNLNNTTFTIDLGSTATEMLNIKSNKINIDSENGVTGENEINVQTDILKLNKNSTKTYVEVNEIDSKVVIGGEELNETIVNGSNVYIGKGGGFVTIYGNLIQYSEGSNVNIVTNTTTEETSAFHVHNTGTKTALTVIQDNKVSGGGYNLVEFFTQENQDRIPFRVDDIGRVGLGVSESSNLQAWLHVNRNDPDIIGPDYDDLVLVEDTDNDSTPFIIKKEGDIGIGTKTPKYKLDVWTNGSELNGQGDTIRSKGIALRDVVYVKQHETNRILFGLGNKLYLHDGATKLDEIFKSGFTFEHDLTDTENPFNTDITDGTFVFRMSCKIHIAGNDGNVAFRRFEAFVNPQNGTFSNKQMPAHILLTDNVDSVYEHFEFNPIVGGTEYKTTVENVNGTSWKLIIPWKLRSVDPITGSAFTSYPSKSRVYLDVEFFGSEDIGDIKAIPLHLKDDAVF